MGGPTAGLTAGPAFSVPAKKMAMWLFIIADTATFAACLVAYGFIRNATPNWPRPYRNITDVALMTLIHVTSSLTMLLGIKAAKAGDKSGALRWTFITAAAGIIFALLHIREWMALIGEGMTLLQNPWGTGPFSSAFFSITGLHLTHVTAGVIALTVVGIRYHRGRYRSDALAILGARCHFAEIVRMSVVLLASPLRL